MDNVQHLPMIDVTVSATATTKAGLAKAAFYPETRFPLVVPTRSQSTLSKSIQEKIALVIVIDST